jgi:hypothetical protein
MNVCMERGSHRKGRFFTFRTNLIINKYAIVPSVLANKDVTHLRMNIHLASRT